MLYTFKLEWISFLMAELSFVSSTFSGRQSENEGSHY